MQVVSRKDTQPISQAIEHAENTTKKLEAGRQSIKDLEQVVQAQTAKVTEYAKSWVGIILAVLSYTPPFLLMDAVSAVVRACLDPPSPVLVTQEAVRGLERQQKIVDCTKQAIEDLDSECHSAIQTHNTLQVLLIPGIESTTVYPVNQFDRVRPVQLRLGKEIARTMRKTHKMIHLDRPQFERRLEFVRTTVGKVRSLENSDRANFWVALASHMKEDVGVEKLHRLEDRTTGSQEEDDSGSSCFNC